MIISKYSGIQRQRKTGRKTINLLENNIIDLCSFIFLTTHNKCNKTDEHSWLLCASALHGSLMMNGHIWIWHHSPGYLLAAMLYTCEITLLYDWLPGICQGRSWGSLPIRGHLRAALDLWLCWPTVGHALPLMSLHLVPAEKDSADSRLSTPTGHLRSLERDARAMEAAARAMEEASKSASESDRPSAAAATSTSMSSSRKMVSPLSSADEPPSKRMAMEEDRLMAQMGMRSAHMKITSRGKHWVSHGRLCQPCCNSTVIDVIVLNYAASASCLQISLPFMGMSPLGNALVEWLIGRWLDMSTLHILLWSANQSDSAVTCQKGASIICWKTW